MLPTELFCVKSKTIQCVCGTYSHLFCQSNVQPVLCYCLVSRWRTMCCSIALSSDKSYKRYKLWINFMNHMLLWREQTLLNTRLELYYLAQSECRSISETPRTKWYWNAFLPTSIRLLMRGLGEGSEWGKRRQRQRQRDWLVDLLTRFSNTHMYRPHQLWPSLTQFTWHGCLMK